MVSEFYVYVLASENALHFHYLFWNRLLIQRPHTVKDVECRSALVRVTSGAQFHFLKVIRHLLAHPNSQIVTHRKTPLFLSIRQVAFSFRTISVSISSHLFPK